MAQQIDLRFLVDELCARGYGEDVTWAESRAEPTNALNFAYDLIYVICNSGMKFTIARKIYDRVIAALTYNASASDVFHHLGKSKAIDFIWAQRERLFGEYLAASDKLAYLEALPWLGPTTKYHAAKNFGFDCAKPDVHLTRLARAFETTPADLCALLAKSSGYRVGTVDTVLWRACAIGLLDSRTGKITAGAKAIA